MKKVYLLAVVLLSYVTIFAQAGLKEYRYFGIKFGLSSNISMAFKNNPNILIKSPYGDLLKNYSGNITYTPGGNFEFIYNVDSKNNKTGFVLGLNFDYMGFRYNYISDTLNYKASEQYRTMVVGIPLVLKYGTSNIYKNQLYTTFGIQYNIYLMQQTLQKASWSSSTYIANIPRDAATFGSIALLAGFNYNIYFIKFQYITKNFVNTKYTTNLQEGIVQPYQHINATNNIYLTIGVNIPLTRWLTTRSWTAEQIRRFLKGSR